MSKDFQLWSTWNLSEIDLEKEYKEKTEASRTVVFEMAGISQKKNNEMLTSFGIDELQYSSLTKLLNVTTYVQVFVDKIKKKQTSLGNLKQDETQKAEKLWIKCIQQKRFMIKEGCTTKDLQKSPYIHEDNIFRHFGGLQNAYIPHGSINSILLPRKYIRTRLIIEDIH